MSASTADLSKKLGDIVERGDFVVPPYPAAAMRLRSLIESDKFGLSQIADAAAADAALAAALLRIANSPVYRGDGPPLTTLLRAVNRLGARAVSSLSLAAGIGAAATSPGALADVKYRVWRRSVTCALAAQRFAGAHGVDPEVAFLAGLLHGFGRSVALACLEKLLATSSETHSVPEWLALVEQHGAALATRVASLWQLPPTIVDAMSAEPHASGASHTVVALADRLALALDRGASSQEAAAELGFDAKQAALLDKFVAHLPGALEAFIQAPDAPKKARTASAVNKPPSMLAGEQRGFSLPVIDLRKGRTPEPFESVAIAPLGLVVTSARPLQESSVIRLCVQAEPPIEAWFNVVLCAPEKQRFRIELQAFAPSSEFRERVSAIWTSAPPLPRTSLPV
jgi:HD-like signal output (HDOD) protein